MDATIFLILLQDGLLNGAIYALLGLALVMVFAVTRIIFIPQGEFVTFGALTLAFIINGRMPGTVWLLLIVGILVTAKDLWELFRQPQGFKLWRAVTTVAWSIGWPVLMLLITPWVMGRELPLVVSVLYSLAVVVPLGPMLYKLVYQPMAEASVLVLLITSVALHFALTGLGLVFFGAEGWRTPAFMQGQMDILGMMWSAQTVFVLVACSVLIGALWLFFGVTLYGRALRATAVNRRGARLVGISTRMSGRITFFLAAAVGAFSGMLIAPVTTIYYDTGFLIGLKGFVGAIIGGLASYPITAIGAIFVGILEAFSSFWASQYKEVIVFALIIPVLLWRSFGMHILDDED